MSENRETYNLTKGPSDNQGLFPPIVCINYGPGAEPTVESVALTPGQIVVTVSINGGPANGGSTSTATIKFQAAPTQ
jgi:hypothetical protein